jgi:hypothetical protein
MAPDLPRTATDEVPRLTEPDGCPRLIAIRRTEATVLALADEVIE